MSGQMVWTVVSRARRFSERAIASRALVTDLRMMGMSGIELQLKLSECGCNIPVIVITAHATTPVTVQAIQSGAVTLLDKPYREDELWNAIRKALTLDS